MPTSSVPRTKAWLLIVFSAVCAAQDAAQRPLFWHRALVPPGDRARVLKLLDPDIRGPQFDQPLRDAYGQIEPERSLLIHDCTIGGSQRNPDPRCIVPYEFDTPVWPTLIDRKSVV